MTDEELIESLRAVCTCNIDSTPCMAEDDCRDALAAADRIEALVKQCKGLAQAAMNNGQALILAEDRAKRLEEALIWCSGSADFHEGGFAREGWLNLCAPLLKGADHE